MAVGSELDVNIKAAVTDDTNCLQDNEKNYGQSDVCATSDSNPLSVNSQTACNTNSGVTDNNQFVFDRSRFAGRSQAVMGLHNQVKDYNKHLDINDRDGNPGNNSACNIDNRSNDQAEKHKSTKEQGSQTEDTECLCSCHPLQIRNYNGELTDDSDKEKSTVSVNVESENISVGFKPRKYKKASNASHNRFNVTPVSIKKGDSVKSASPSRFRVTPVNLEVDNSVNRTHQNRFQVKPVSIEKTDSSENNACQQNVPIVPTIFINGVLEKECASITETTSLLHDEHSQDSSIGLELQNAFSKNPTRAEVEQLGHMFRSKYRSLRRNDSSRKGAQTLPREELEGKPRRLNRFTIVPIPEAALEEDKEEYLDPAQLTFTKEHLYFNEKVLPKSREKLPEVKIRPRPNDYFMLSCFTCLCCNPLFGGVALGCAIGANAAFEDGKTELARRRGIRALQCSIFAIVVTLVLMVFLALFLRPDIFLRFS